MHNKCGDHNKYIVNLNKISLYIQSIYKLQQFVFKWFDELIKNIVIFIIYFYDFFAKYGNHLWNKRNNLWY